MTEGAAEDVDVGDCGTAFAANYMVSRFTSGHCVRDENHSRCSVGRSQSQFVVVCRSVVSLMNVSSIASIAGDSGAVPAGAGVDVFNPVSDSLWRKSTTGWTHRYRCLSDCTVQYFYYVSASFRLPRCGSIS